MRSIIFILVLGFLSTSCGKFLEEYSQDLVVPKTVNDFNEILLGNGYLPSKEVSELNRGDLLWWLHLLDDDMNTVEEPTAVRGTFEMDDYYYGYTTWQLEVGRSYNGLKVSPTHGLWEDLYRRINVANIVLDEIQNIDIVAEADQAAKNRVMAEAYFLRAQYYYYLVNIYSPAYNPVSAESDLGVPLKLSSYVEHDKSKESQFERASVSEIYDQIVADLINADGLLTQGDNRNTYYRASKDAVKLFLSRVYLYMQQWEQASLVAKEVVQSRALLLDYSSVPAEQAGITEDNPEIIFSQGSLNTQNAFLARGGDFCVSEELYDLYSEDDYRKDLFFQRSNFSDSIALARKYKRGLHFSKVSDLYTLRASEAYLNLIEGLALSGQVAEANEWLKQIKAFRSAAVHQDIVDQQALVKEVRMERRRELCFEGHRWFDLRRYAVDRKFPETREITRAYSVYDWNDKNKLIKTEVYKLKKSDLAYTFLIPDVVTDFDRGMQNNKREKREAISESINP